MKLALLLSSILVASVGSVVVLAKSEVITFSSEHMARLKGTDAYFSVGETEAILAPFETRLRGSPSTVVILGITFTYRTGLETKNGPALIAKQATTLRDAIPLVLNDFTKAQLETPAEIFRLKRRLRDTIEKLAFAGGEARVEKVYFEPFLMRDAGEG